MRDVALFGKPSHGAGAIAQEVTSPAEVDALRQAGPRGRPRAGGSHGDAGVACDHLLATACAREDFWQARCGPAQAAMSFAPADRLDP